MITVADPGFSWGAVANLLNFKFVAENCMKMKEFGPRDRPWRPLGSANG